MAWQVITQFYNTGKIKAWITKVQVKLENIQDDGENFDKYIDYFDTEISWRDK